MPSPNDLNNEKIREMGEAAINFTAYVMLPAFAVGVFYAINKTNVGIPAKIGASLLTTALAVSSFVDLYPKLPTFDLSPSLAYLTLYAAVVLAASVVLAKSRDLNFRTAGLTGLLIFTGIISQLMTRDIQAAPRIQNPTAAPHI